MDWWQILLIILLFIVIGLVVGYILGYLVITRILRRPFVLFPARQRRGAAVAEAGPKFTRPSIFSRVAGIRDDIRPRSKGQVGAEVKGQTGQEAAVVEETPQADSSGAIAELVEEQVKKRIQQQARVRAEREAEEAKDAREAQERARQEAEQQAIARAMIKAEEDRIAKEAQERTRQEAEQQAIMQAKIKAEEDRITREAKQQARQVAEQQARAQAEIEAEEAIRAIERQEQLIEEPSVVEEPAKAAIGLLAEVKNNSKIANEPWTGTLIPFQTEVWDASPSELHALPVNLREDLTQAYSDIQLANSIVWLARELKRRSPNLDDNYTKLCSNVAARLEAIISQLEQAGKL